MTSRTSALMQAMIACALMSGGAATAAECRKGPVTVGYIPKLDTDPFFQSANTGAQKAQSEIGGKIVLQAPSQATAEAQIVLCRAGPGAVQGEAGRRGHVYRGPSWPIHRRRRRTRHPGSPGRRHGRQRRQLSVLRRTR